MTEHIALPLGYFQRLRGGFFQSECWSITGPEHDLDDHWNIVADNIDNEDFARLIVTACNCHAELLEACLNALGAYEALESLGADKELPGYEKCLAFLKQAIRKAKE